jgi:hypothetical protein
MRRESFVRLPTLISAVESSHTSMHYPASMPQTDGSGPFLKKIGSIRGEGPSGEERTPGRSTPLELCSTEDHDHHLYNEAAAKKLISAYASGNNRSRGESRNISSSFLLGIRLWRDKRHSLVVLCFPRLPTVPPRHLLFSGHGCVRDFPLD